MATDDTLNNPDETQAGGQGTQARPEEMAGGHDQGFREQIPRSDSMEQPGMADFSDDTMLDDDDLDDRSML